MSKVPRDCCCFWSVNMLFFYQTIMSAPNSIGGTVRLVLKGLCLAFLLFVQIVVNCSLLIAKIIELYNFLET